MIFVWSILIFAGLLLVLAAGLYIAERYLVDYGTCRIEINAGEKVLEVEGGATLLQTLIDHEIYIPSACGGKGTCGFCKIQVEAGAGSVLPTETAYLSRREVRAGVRLACQVKVRGDLQLRVPEELLNVRLFSATVEDARMLTDDIRALRLRLDDGQILTQRAGQYVQVEAPSPDGPVFRAYSISSPEHEPQVVELVVRLVPGGLASTHLHRVQPGEPLRFTGPYGEFRLSEDPDVEIVCVGGGCGMAPMRNILRTLHARWPDRRCWLFFGCRTRAEAIYRDEFRRLAEQHPNLQVVYALSEEPGGDEWDGETGFIHLPLDRLLPPGPRRQAFLCGPEPMIEAVTAVLHAKGLSDRDIFYDKF